MSTVTYSASAYIEHELCTEDVCFHTCRLWRQAYSQHGVCVVTHRYLVRYLRFLLDDPSTSTQAAGEIQLLLGVVQQHWADAYG